MNNVTFTANEDGSVTVKGTPSATTTYVFCALSDILEAGKDYMGYGLDSGQTSNIYFGLLGVSGVPNKRFYDSVTPFSTADISTKYTNVIIRVDGSSAINITLHPMICEKTLYDTDQSYVPYALPNHELTRLEADDRTSLAEVVDSGAKNLVEVTSSNISTTSSNVTVTVNSDKSIKITGNGSAVGGLTIVYIPVYIPAGTYVLSGCPSGANYESGYTCDLRDTNNSSRSNSDTGNGTEFTLSSGGNYRWCIRLAATYTIPSGGVTFKPMICTKAAFGVSKAFVPYRPNWDLVCTNLNKLKNGATIRSSLNGNYSYHGFKIKNSRGSGVVCFMGNGYDNGAGVISFSYQTSRDSVYVDKKMTQPSYVKFYHDANAFYIVFFTSTKWDDISLSGTFINESDSLVEEYFSNTEVPSGATQVTETAYPTA